MGSTSSQELVLIMSSLKSNGSTSQWKKIAQRIRERDQFTCQICGRYGNSIDHIIPRSAGGGDEEWNLQCLCTPCNSAKGGRNIINEPLEQNSSKGGFFSGAKPPLTLSWFNSPQNDSKSHENE